MNGRSTFLNPHFKGTQTKSVSVLNTNASVSGLLVWSTYHMRWTGNSQDVPDPTRSQLVAETEVRARLTMLEQELARLRADNAQLRRENAELKTQLAKR